MKGRVWELAPIVIAAAIAFGFAVGRRRSTPSVLPPPPPPFIPAAPAARPSFGPGDPTRPEDFKPDSTSKPDPQAPPDAAVPADKSSAPDPGTVPPPAPAAH